MVLFEKIWIEVTVRNRIEVNVRKRIEVTVRYWIEVKVRKWIDVRCVFRFNSLTMLQSKYAIYKLV